MAKKAVKKTSDSKEVKKTKKRDSVGYSEFIRTVIFSKISEKCQWIHDICEKYKGINEAPLEVWKQMDEIVMDISREAARLGETGHHYRTEPVKRATYNISHRVREMQRKDMIIDWADQWDDNDNDWNVHVCNQIWLDIAIWLSENSKVEKESKKKSESRDD